MSEESSEEVSESSSSSVKRVRKNNASKLIADREAKLTHKVDSASEQLALLQAQLAAAQKAIEEKDAAIAAATAKIETLETVKPFPSSAHEPAAKQPPVTLTVSIDALCGKGNAHETCVNRSNMPELLIIQSAEPVADPLLCALQSSFLSDAECAVQLAINHTSDDRYLLPSSTFPTVIAALRTFSIKMLQNRLRNLKSNLADRGHCMTCTPHGCPVTLSNAAYVKANPKRKRGDRLPTCPVLICANMNADTLTPIVSSTSAIPLVAFAIAKFPPLSVAAAALEKSGLDNPCKNIADAVEAPAFDESLFRPMPSEVSTAAIYIVRALRSIHQSILRVVATDADTDGSYCSEEKSMMKIFTYGRIEMPENMADVSVISPTTMTIAEVNTLSSYYLDCRKVERRESRRSSKRSGSNSKIVEEEKKEEENNAEEEEEIAEGENNAEEEDAEIAEGENAESAEGDAEEESEISETFE
jgi:hypothetical protein